MSSAMRLAVLIVTFCLVTACGSAESEWKTAKERDTVEAYERFVEKYPKDSNAVVALKEIELLKISALQRAARNNDRERIESLLAAGADVNTLVGVGTSALHVAAGKCHGELAGYLIGKGANVSLRDEANVTPLHRVAGAGCLAAITLLLEKGADIEAEIKPGLTGYVNKDGVGTYFGDHSAETNGTPLHWAARAGQVAAVKLLIAKGAVVNSINGLGESPLHLAATSGNVDAVNALLASGAIAQYPTKPDMHDRGVFNVYPSDHGQPMHYASTVAIVEALLRHGATIDVVTELSGMPIHSAASRGQLAVVEYYLSKGTKVDATANWNLGSGWGSDVTPLWTAAKGGHLELVKWLVERGADVKFRVAKAEYDWEAGPTVLHVAAASGNPELVTYLLDHKLGIEDRAQVSTERHLVNPLLQMTPLAVAAFFGRTAVVDVLLTRGADVNARVNGKWSLFEVAVLSGDPKLVRMMLERGMPSEATIEGIDRWRMSAEMRATVMEFLLMQRDSASKKKA